MALAPTSSEHLARARGDLRLGLPVVLGNGDTGALAIAAELLNPDRLQDIRRLGTPYLALTGRRAETLKARSYDGDIARIELPTEADIGWIRAVVDPVDDLAVPLKGPLISLRGGDSTPGRAAIGWLKAARLLPAALLVDIADAQAFALAHNLSHIELTEPVIPATALYPVVSARLPLAVSRAGRLHVFRPSDGTQEHYAVEIGQPDRTKPVLTRLHSACFTGDLLGSLKCDCGPQLHGALAQMGAAGAGVLLYLNQEGRGIGLSNKMRAYALQDQGFDTVEANHRLGFEDDERDFQIGADILSQMGFDTVRLLTNNPAKVARMQENNIKVVERVPLRVGENPLNADYLRTKADKSGHLL